MEGESESSIILALEDAARHTITLLDEKMFCPLLICERWRSPGVASGMIDNLE